MGGELILVIDDNAMNRKLSRVALEADGYRVETAVDTRDARERLRHCRPRLILMDFQMPGEDGLSLTRELKRDPATRHIRVLMLTSYDLKGDEARARAAGCDDYLLKPLDTLELLHRIADHLREGPAPGAGEASPNTPDGPTGEKG